jgi:hypothetical protein
MTSALDAIADSWLAYLERSPEAVVAVAAALCRCVQALPRGATAGPPPPLPQALGLRGGGLRRAAVSLRMLDATQPRLAMVLRRHLLALAVLRTDDGRWAAAGGASTMRLRPWLATLCSAEHTGGEARVAARADAAGAWALDIASAARIDALVDRKQQGQSGCASAVIALCIRRLSVVAVAQKHRGEEPLGLPPQTNAHLNALDGVQRQLMVSDLCQHLQYAAPRWRPQLCCALAVFLPFYLDQLGGEETCEQPENRQRHVEGPLAELLHLLECVVEVLESSDCNSEPAPELEPEPEHEPSGSSAWSPPEGVDEQWSEDWSEQQHWEAVLGSAPLLPSDEDLSLRDFVLAFLATDALCLPLLAQLSGSDVGVAPEVCAILSRLVLLGHDAARTKQTAATARSSESERASKSESIPHPEPQVTVGEHRLSVVGAADESPGRNDDVLPNAPESEREQEQLAGRLAGAQHQTDEVDETDRYSDSFEPSSDEGGAHLQGGFEGNAHDIEAADSDVVADRADLQLRLELHPAASADLCYALVYCGLMLLPAAYLPRKVRHRQCVRLIALAQTVTVNAIDQHNKMSIVDACVLCIQVPAAPTSAHESISFGWAQEALAARLRGNSAEILPP